MNLIAKRSLFFLVIVLSFISCKKKDKRSQAQKDEDIIQAYISDNKLDAHATGSGLYYVMTSPGTGIQPNINSNVTVKYSGQLTNGKIFDQSGSAGITFGLNSVIKGWQEGIPLFKKGGSGTLLIPSALGYGSQSQGSIPPNSVLVFDIDLLNVQ